MRPSCRECVVKHLAQARYLANNPQAVGDFASIRSHVIGHMAEAEDEIVFEDLNLSQFIRANRLKFAEGRPIDFDAIVSLLESTETSSFPTESLTILRESFGDRVSRHIGQAIINLSEAFKGYPKHFSLALAHLRKASKICPFPITKKYIRQLEEDLRSGEFTPDLMSSLDVLKQEIQTIKKG